MQLDINVLESQGDIPSFEPLLKEVNLSNEEKVEVDMAWFYLFSNSSDELGQLG